MGVDLFDQLGFTIMHKGAPIHTVAQTPAIDFKGQFPTVFSGFGQLKGFEHAPRVDPTAKPVSQQLALSLTTFPAG